MNQRITPLSIMFAVSIAMPAGAGEPEPATHDWLEAAVAGEHRDPAKRARDPHRSATSTTGSAATTRPTCSA